MINLLHLYMRLRIFLIINFADDSIPVVAAAEYHDDDVAPEDGEETDTESEILRINILLR